MASQVYTEKQLNYFRICYIATDILPRSLRAIFKQEWDNRYKATLGEWQDTPKNGMDFRNGESPASQRRNARLLTTMINGNRSEWDCTMLFYAILHSDSIHGLHPVIRSSVDDLRGFRNEDFAHMPQGQLSDLDFRVAVRKVEIAFRYLSLSTAHIQNISKQKIFPTNELQTVLKKVQNLKQELQKRDAKLQSSEEQRKVLEGQLRHKADSFCVLPPKPSHQIAGRNCEAGKIEKELDNLRKANHNSLSYCYISGNPGSGKSQLAGLVAKKVYDEAINDPSSLSFVMTLNAENAETLLESYVSLARKVSCPEYTITNTQTSEDMKIDEKISNLKDLITTKIHHYKWWLLVVDNVTSVSRTQGFLPEPGNEQWGKGQLLITTQDSSSVPPDSSFSSHISVSKGMEHSDAACLLSMLSGIKVRDLEGRVAKALDYQPLALASAATYVNQVRQLCPSFGWNDYLEKLEQGKRALTENVLSKTNPSYPSSMTAATRMAVEREMNSNEVMKHAFSFLALCSPQLLKLDFLTNYILIVDKDQDKEEIGIQIQGSSLFLIEKQEDGVYLRQHQVVHDVVKLLCKDSMNNDERARAVGAAVKSFNQFIDKVIPTSWYELDSIAESRNFAPHLKTLIEEIEMFFSSEAKYGSFPISILDISSFHLQRLGRVSENHYNFLVAKAYYNASLTIIEGKSDCDDDDLTSGYIFLGGVNLKLESFQEAKECYERALSINLKRRGSKHIADKTIYYGLGLLHSHLGNHHKAKKHFEHVLSWQLKKLAPKHVQVADTSHNLGVVQWHLGDYQQAKENYERALSVQLEKLGPEHVKTADTYHNLGSLMFDLGDHHQAKEHFERALSVQLKKLGSKHVKVADTYESLGYVHKHFGDHPQAKEYFSRALAIRAKQSGRRHLLMGNAFYPFVLAYHDSLVDDDSSDDYDSSDDSDQVVGHSDRQLSAESCDSQELVGQSNRKRCTVQ